MTNDAAAPTPQRPRWLYGALIASLAVNLVVLGSAAGAFWHHRHERHEHSLSGFVRKLPQDRQGPLGDFVASERAKLKSIREEIRSGFKESNGLLGEEPFDKEKLKAAMGRMNEAEARLRAAIGDALVETAAKMTPEERQSLKQWRERRAERGMKKWRRDRDNDDGHNRPPPPRE